MKKIVCLLMVLFSQFAFADWGNPEKRIETPLHVFEYNSFARQFLDRPTRITVQKVGSEQSIWIRYDSYDSKKTDNYAIFSKQYVDDYLAYISKYQEWNEKAKQAGDSFEKDIGKASSQMGFKLKFGFYSGNSQKHYLVISPCVLLMCGSSGMYLDEASAAELVKLLNQLKNNELIAEDVGNKYN